VCDAAAVADGLDSAGCSPKDDEDDDSDIEAPENSGAAALKPNKISPAGGYHTGSSYYIPIAKEKSWLARCDDRDRLPSSESNSGCMDPSDNSFYNRCQLRRSDDGAPAGRGLTPSSDLVMERMMRRKEARRQRERANLTESDSVAGYRGRDCSIDELIEYIDAKHPSVPKSGQKRTGNRKSRKKKRTSNRPAKSTGDVSSSTPVGSSRVDGDATLDKTSPENFAAEPVVAADADVRTTDEHLTRVSLDNDDKVDLEPEPMSELPLRSDAFFQMLPSDGSSSNTSDADNVSDTRADSSFGNYARFSNRYREPVDVPSPGAGSQAGCVDDNLSVKVDPEPMSMPGTQSSETVTSAEVDQFVTAALHSCCLKQSNRDSTLDSVNCEEGRNTHTDTNSPRDEIIVPNAENCSPSVSSSFIGLSADSVVDSINGFRAMQRRHSDVLGSAAVRRGIACQSSESVHGAQKDNGQSTPSSSISEARDLRDFDSQSLADDMSSDFDFSAPTSHESDFTVVTQKRKKRQSRSNVGSAAGCLRRTFYNRNHQDGLAGRDWQSHCRNESAVRDSGTVPSTVNAMRSSASSNLELHSLPVSEQSSLPLEVSVGTEYTCTESDTNSPNNATSTVLESMQSALSGRESTSSQYFTGSSAVHSCKTSESVKDAKRSSIDHRTQEKLFLDTRRPNAGATPSAAIPELSFWYDVSIPESQATSLLADTATLAPPGYNVGELGVNAEVSSIVNFPTNSVVTSSASSLTCTVSESTHLHSCTDPAVAAGNGSSTVVNSSRLAIHARDVPLVNNDPQPSVQSPLSHLASTTDASSNRSDSVNNSTGHSGSDVIRPGVSSTVSQSPAVVNASATDSVHRSTDRGGRQLFNLQDAQLFLYTG